MRKGVKIKQHDIADCGAACLVSVSAHYRLQLPISRVRQIAGTDKQGTSVLGIVEAAEKLGFQAKAAKGNIDSLAGIPLPAIAHLVVKNVLNHYVVIYNVTSKYVAYMDPMDGEIHTRSLQEFAAEWTGVIILLLPEEDFKEGSQKTSNVSRFWELLAPHKSMLLQALIGALIYTILGLSSSLYVQKIVDFVLVEGNIRLLNLLSIIMLIILVFQMIISYFKSMIGLRTGQMIDARLILGYYKHLFRLPQRFFDTMRVGEIISRINDAVKIRAFINDVALTMVVNILVIVFSIGIMFLYYWKLALIMLAIIPIYFIVYQIANRINKIWQRRLMENGAELEAQLVESINAAGTVKRFGLEDYITTKTETRFVTLLRSIYTSSVKGLHLGNAASFVTSLFTIIILWVGSYYVVQRELSPGELLSFYALIGYFTGPAASLITANKSIQDALIAANRLFEIVDLEVESGDTNKVTFLPGMMGDIVFNNVYFRYGTRAMVFEGLNMAIQKNKSTAVVGESGSGKSTLVSLVQNLYPLNEGNIAIGALDIKYISNSSLREAIAIVPQQVDLFAGTIIENIAIGDYEPDIAKIMALCKLLGINEFIEKLPSNYNTLISEQGVNFSGGEKQRIAIARALYRNPEILILDEATSSLDPISEQKVQETLRWFKGQDKTIITIAHRLSTVKNADEILVLENGKLIEQGTHAALLQLKGKYALLWQSQHA